MNVLQREAQTGTVLSGLSPVPKGTWCCVTGQRFPDQICSHSIPGCLGTAGKASSHRRRYQYLEIQLINHWIVFIPFNCKYSRWEKGHKSSPCREENCGNRECNNRWWLRRFRSPLKPGFWEFHSCVEGSCSCKIVSSLESWYLLSYLLKIFFSRNIQNLKI